jgi:phosphoserine phosphatase
MTGFHLVVRAPEIATGDLKALARLCSVRASGASPAGLPHRRGRSGVAQAVAAIAKRANLDWGFVPEGRRLADFGLLAVDMDSTVITIECIDEIADYAGRKSEVAAVTQAAMRGEIDWPEACGGVEALAGLPESVLERVWRKSSASRPAPKPSSRPRGAPASRPCSSPAASPISPIAFANGWGSTRPGRTSW